MEYRMKYVTLTVKMLHKLADDSSLDIETPDGSVIRVKLEKGVKMYVVEVPYSEMKKRFNLHDMN